MACRRMPGGYPRGVFTGIVREIGRIESAEGGEDGVRLVVRAPETAGRTALGDSVLVSGVCLTAVAVENGTLAFEAVPETLRRSSLGSVEPGAAVNVEPALRAGEPLGGHVVQGHVDGVGRISAVGAEGDGRRLEVEVPPELVRYLVEKGSVAVEGVSLTVAAIRDDTIEIALVPHTLEATTLGTLSPGDEVNLEVDVLAKYVERLLEARA
jgi:riboflavin synthase